MRDSKKLIEAARQPGSEAAKLDISEIPQKSTCHCEEHLKNATWQSRMYKELDYFADARIDNLSEISQEQQTDNSLPSYLPTLQPSKPAFTLSEVKGKFPPLGGGLGRGGDLKSSEQILHPSLKFVSSLPFANKFFSLPRREKRIAFTLAEVLITLGVIGVVAAMTLSNLIKNYEKYRTVSQLKKAYVTLQQAVMFAQNEYGNIDNWDYDLTPQKYMNTYIAPFIKNIKSSNNKYYLPDGTSIDIKYNGSYKSVFGIEIDINADRHPNVYGKDKFLFYILPKPKNYYNAGTGSFAKNVIKSGLYPDGYGYSRNELKNDGWRGCNKRNDTSSSGFNTGYAGAFCTGLILLDGWKISDDYLW